MVSAQIGPEAGPAGLGAEEGLLSPCCVGRPLPALGYKSRDPRETGRAGAGPWEELGAPLGGRAHPHSANHDRALVPCVGLRRMYNHRWAAGWQAGLQGTEIGRASCRERVSSPV